MFFYRLCMTIERIRSVTMMYDFTSANMNLAREFFVRKCFLGTPQTSESRTSEDVDQLQSTSDECLIQDRAFQLFEATRQRIMDKIVNDHAESKEKEYKNLSSIVGRGVHLESKYSGRIIFTKLETQYIAGKIIFEGKVPSKEKQKYPTFESLQEEDKKKPQERKSFMDYIYRIRGFVTAGHETFKFAKILDTMSQLPKNEAILEEQNFEPTSLPPLSIQKTFNTQFYDKHAPGQFLSNSLSELVRAYLRNVADRNNSLVDFRRQRMNIMKNRLTFVANNGEYKMDYRTSIIIKRMRHRLKYLLSQPNHSVPIEKKEEAIIAYLRMISSYLR
nr:unnamed protein product [Naegleria fowleri]